jgi:hypothetical protein
MTETFRCGDESALVAFLYDECEPAERETIAAHVASCLRCTSELDSLSATRRHLSLWAPPDARLGFRITSEQVNADRVNNTVVDARGAFGAAASEGTANASPWWRRPLPAWAQAAAAAAIFAAGLGVGTARTAPAPPSTDAADLTALRQIAALERRIANMERASQPRLATASDSHEATGRSDLVRWVRGEIDASERRQNSALSTMARQMAWEQDVQLGGFEERVDQRVAQVVDREVKPLYWVLSANNR